MIRIIADDKIPFLKGVLEPYAEITYIPGRLITRDIVRNADALLIRTRTKCTPALLSGSNVQFIGTATIGFDHIDAGYCESHNIKWTNSPGCNSNSVQQYIAAALLRLSERHLNSLKDKTLGIVGVGNVGSKIESLAGALGMKVLLNDPPRARIEGEKSFVKLETILDSSDVITLHVPLNFVGEDKTYHLFDENIFKKIRKGIWLINSSRGEVVDTHSLKMALKSGELNGAIIDVWENEPDIDPELIQRAFIATPHIAGYSTDGKANGTAMVVNALCHFFNMKLKHWYPEDIPKPSDEEIIIDCEGKTDEDIIRQAVSMTYKIDEDDLNFRNSPINFEKQRECYPLRREFRSYTVRLKGGTKRIHKTLELIGFRISY